MNDDGSMKIDRLAAAGAISLKAVAMGAELGVTVSECVWDIGADLGHEYAHRLDLSTATSSVRLYFSDLDLTTSNKEPRKEKVEDRLQRAIAQLVARPPSTTYTYR